MQAKNQVTVRYKGRRSAQRTTGETQVQPVYQRQRMQASITVPKNDSDHGMRSPFGNAPGIRKALATMQEDMDRIKKKSTPG